VSERNAEMIISYLKEYHSIVGKGA